MNTLSPIIPVVIALAFLAGNGVRADVIDHYSILTAELQEATLNACGEKSDPAQWSGLLQSADHFSAEITAPFARELWQKVLGDLQAAAPADFRVQAKVCAEMQAQLQYICSLELLSHQKQNDIKGAQEWRALITLPKHANAIEGALALQSQATHSSQIQPITQLLAQECLE